MEILRLGLAISVNRLLEFSVLILIFVLEQLLAEFLRSKPGVFAPGHVLLVAAAICVIATMMQLTSIDRLFVYLNLITRKEKQRKGLELLNFASVGVCITNHLFMNRKHRDFVVLSLLVIINYSVMLLARGLGGKKRLPIYQKCYALLGSDSLYWSINLQNATYRPNAKIDDEGVAELNS